MEPPHHRTAGSPESRLVSGIRDSFLVRRISSIMSRHRRPRADASTVATAPADSSSQWRSAEPRQQSWLLPDRWIWLATRAAAERSRRSRFDLFMHRMRPGEHDCVLDVGVGEGAGRTINFFEEWYPWRRRIVAVALEDLPRFRARYPEIRLHVGDGRQLPFAERSFDIWFSNAVIEHVGTAEQQRAFVHEACRVADRVFLSTPNRWFPIDLHTMIPFAHWLPVRARNAVHRVLGQSCWASDQALHLLGLSGIRACVPPGWGMEVNRQRLLGWTVNFNIVLHRH